MLPSGFTVRQITGFKCLIINFLNVKHLLTKSQNFLISSLFFEYITVTKDSSFMNDQLLTVALAQISPIWLDKNATIEKIKKSII